MAALHIGLGAQVFQVEPRRRRAVCTEPVHIALHEFGWDLAAKGFDQHLAGGQFVGPGERLRPRQHLHPGAALGGHPGQGPRIVHPQAHQVAARGELARQPPTHAQIAVVVDDAAEEVPLHAPIVGRGRRHNRGR